jgi:hypothetical protein
VQLEARADRHMALAKQPTLPARWKREVDQLGALSQCASASRFCNKV